MPGAATGRPNDRGRLYGKRGSDRRKRCKGCGDGVRGAYGLEVLTAEVEESGLSDGEATQ